MFLVVFVLLAVGVLMMLFKRLYGRWHEFTPYKPGPYAPCLSGDVSSTMPPAAPPNYEACESLLSPAERSFFGVLEQAVARDYRLFAKVRLSDIVHPARGASRSGWQSAFNRISAKHVDFVLCDRQTFSVLGVVELDDKSHTRFDRGFRDQDIDSILSDAGIPVIRVPARGAYSPALLRQQIDGAIRSSQAGEPRAGQPQTTLPGV